MRYALSGLAGPGRVRSVGVDAGEETVRAPGSAGSSGPEGGAAASARAALYPGEEAPRRHPVTPGPAGPSGLRPRHSLALARRPTIATDLPADRRRSPQRATDRPLPPPAGQQQAPSRPGPTPLNGRLQPPGSRAWREIGDAARRSVLYSTPTGGNACPSLFSPSEPAFFLGPHWLRPLACPAPGGLRVPRRGCASRTEPAGGRGLQGAWERRPAPAKLGFRHEPTGCSLRPPKRLGQRARTRLSVAAGASVPDT